MITWTPEFLYRHLQFGEEDTDESDRLFKAMSASYYAAGITVLEQSEYSEYFAPAITESNLALEAEIGRYSASVTDSVAEAQRKREEVEATYAALPDLHKRQFVSMLGWEMTRVLERKARAKANLDEQALRKVKGELASLKDENMRKKRERQRHAEGRERNLRDPKHLRKRMRQRKKRGRKKRR